MWRLKFLNPSLGRGGGGEGAGVHHTCSALQFLVSSEGLKGNPETGCLHGNTFLLDFHQEANHIKRKKEKKKKEKEESCQDDPNHFPLIWWETKLHIARLLSKICDFFLEHTEGRGLLNNPSVPFRSTACRWWKQTGSLRQQSGCRIIRLNLRLSAYLCPFKDNLQSAGMNIMRMSWPEHRMSKGGAWRPQLSFIYHF